MLAYGQLRPNRGLIQLALFFLIILPAMWDLGGEWYKVHSGWGDKASHEGSDFCFCFITSRYVCVKDGKGDIPSLDCLSREIVGHTYVPTLLSTFWEYLNVPFLPTSHKMLDLGFKTHCWKYVCNWSLLLVLMVFTNHEMLKIEGNLRQLLNPIASHLGVTGFLGSLWK